MIGLILAAGKGSRISQISNGDPKSFLKLGDFSLIEHQINALRGHGIQQIVVVVGYRAHLFEEKFSPENIKIVRNPFYDRTNVLSSVWFAREYLGEGFYFMHADTYFEPSIFNQICDEEGDMVFAVTKKATVEEEMKVKVNNGLVVEINKEMACCEAYGEFIGLAKISEKISPRVVNEIVRLIEVEARHDEYFEAAVQRLIEDGVSVKSFDVGDRLALEIDFPEDYEQAKQLYAKL